MRNILIGLTAILLSACAHGIARHDDLSLDKVGLLIYATPNAGDVDLFGRGGQLTAQPDLRRMAQTLGVTRGTMVEWGMQCRVDTQWRLADCQLLGISPEFADKQLQVASFVNGLSISRVNADVTPDRLAYVGRFHLRNAVPAPPWFAPCHAGSVCPVIHTLERNPPPPPPPPPAPSPTPPQ